VGEAIVAHEGPHQVDLVEVGLVGEGGQPLVGDLAVFGGEASQLGKRGDGSIIDGLGPDGVAKATTSAAGRISVLQSGYLYHYAFAMLIGVVVLISFYLLAH